ncbi:hypothetical protein [Macrococcoides canis]|uniref:hypothetical protein n=1 Tax=Macrococcoides canis TaxID=1855823 RepID=UPI0010FC1508|nr:hypothetical protein [Macrococcus canis]MCO4097495.1 hypothetical protein [Macrococcus canis]QCT75438.1 hypothetical protein EST43_09420 [Macrococcus canis]UTH02037.1 hypothetical protein KFV05_10165 [Macrococcus canis]UTH06475.1 hypothetical protein KFV07_10050 [Macrococcus canis]UTH08804.1 hypothetical protein KFV08_09980 [Macrococcus canis]
MVKKFILKDRDYKENNIALTLVKKEERDVCTVYNLMISYDNSNVSKEIALFEEDILLMNTYKLDSTLNFLYFTEPDLSFTIIDLEDGILVYINLDSGIEYSNIATDSGLSIRLNLTYESFTRFLSSITL